jgi:hypothetical protein
MDYGRIIKRSLEITWRNKVLWIFGLLLRCLERGRRWWTGAGNNLFQYSFTSRIWNIGNLRPCARGGNFAHQM